MLIRGWTLNNKNFCSNSSQIGYVIIVNACPSYNLSNLNFIQNFPLWIWGKSNNLESQWKVIFEMSRDKSVLPVSFCRFEGLGSVSAQLWLCLQRAHRNCLTCSAYTDKLCPHRNNSIAFSQALPKPNQSFFHLWRCIHTLGLTTLPSCLAISSR